MVHPSQTMNSLTLGAQNVQLDLDVFVKDFSGWRDIETVGVRGGYYQPCSPEEYNRRVEAIRSKIANGAASAILVSEFQDWAELDWLRPHGTFETGRQIGRKLVEEAQEYYDEITPMESRAVSAIPNRDTYPGMIEAGDYAWTSMAMASNSGIDVEEALRAKFQTATPITLGDLHDSTRRGFSWIPLRVENPTEVGTVDSDTRDLDPSVWLRLHPRELYRYMHDLYGRGEQKQKPSEAPEKLRLQAADWHADALLFLGYYAHHWTYSSLPEIVAMNFEKVTDRVKRGTVDKASGGRVAH